MSVASGHTIRGRLRARPQVGGHPLGGEKMSPYEVLLTLAEVGATLAALSAVAGVIESRRDDAQQNFISTRLLRDVAVLGMSAALFAILPPIFDHNTVPSEIGTLRYCSGAGLILWVCGYVMFLREARKAVRAAAFSRLDTLVGFVITLFGFGLLASNVINPSAASLWRYPLAIVCSLVLAGLNFLAGVFGFIVRPPAA